MVIEAARDISRTGIHPRRSIDSVLFTGDEEGMPGSWATCARTARSSIALALQNRFPFQMRPGDGVLAERKT